MIRDRFQTFQTSHTCAAQPHLQRLRPSHGERGHSPRRRGIRAHSEGNCCRCELNRETSGARGAAQGPRGGQQWLGSPYARTKEVGEALVDPDAAAAVGLATWGEELGRGQQGAGTNSSACLTGFRQPLPAARLDQRQGWGGGATCHPCRSAAWTRG